MTSQRQTKSAKSSQAFSLVEMVLALGIASFAMVALLGLIPLGLKTSREAIDATIRAQMTQQIVNRIQQDDFAKIDQWQGAKFYFDGEGDQVEGAVSPNAVFAADVNVLAVKATDETMANSAARVISVNIQPRGTTAPSHVVNLVIANTGS